MRNPSIFPGFCKSRYSIKKGQIEMNRPNILKSFRSIHETDWDSLREVPFAGEQDPKTDVRRSIIDSLRAFRKHRKDKPMTAQEFIRTILNDLQPILSSVGMTGEIDNYDFWREALCELEPFLAGYWAECDPMIISYLFMVFVSQFLVLLRLWSKLDFSIYCIKDCAILGEFFLGISAIQNDMLLNTMERWNILGEGTPHYIMED